LQKMIEKSKKSMTVEKIDELERKINVLSSVSSAVLKHRKTWTKKKPGNQEEL